MAPAAQAKKIFMTRLLGASPTFEAIVPEGDAWWEPVGAIHRVSRNPSFTQTAKLLAIYIAPPGATAADLMKPIGASE
jgi:hypothetical protein